MAGEENTTGRLCLALIFPIHSQARTILLENHPTLLGFMGHVSFEIMDYEAICWFFQAKETNERLKLLLKEVKWAYLWLLTYLPN